MPELLTMREFCQALRVCEATGYKLVWTGVVPSLKVGRQLRVKAAEVSAYIDRGQSGGDRC